MRQGPNLNWLADIVLQVHGKSNEVVLRVTPAHVDELRELLEAEGLRAYPALEHSMVNGPMLEMLTVPAAVTGGSVVWAMRGVVLAFMARNKDKEITFGTANFMATFKGTSVKEAERFTVATLEKVEQQRMKLEPLPQARKSDDEVPDTEAKEEVEAKQDTE
ncbi:hypothetical protein BS329_30480 [Amycolatopsis coloradensis]|uniref:Uncharacterized protein n=1 Tax=Amycolatopsis coloradensis TaxID=76021 RepID=A0A1R0KK96_9PSEU|nr:hypothetical protein BS329_30480 [Amycolatopsis coloradensis]